MSSGTTAGALLERLSETGAQLTTQVVDELAAGRARPRAQEGEVTFAPKLTRDDGRLEWREDARTVLARWSGVTPEPGAWTTAVVMTVGAVETARVTYTWAVRAPRS